MVMNWTQKQSRTKLLPVNITFKLSFNRPAALISRY